MSDWIAWAAPAISLSEGWSGPYGGHRALDGRFVTGLVIEPINGTTAIGVDLHLSATPEQYAKLNSDGHVSLHTLTGTLPDLDATLWRMLSQLSAASATHRPTD